MSLTWQEIKTLGRKRGVLIPARPAVRQPAPTARERQVMRDSTRAKRARDDRKAKTS